MLETSTTSLLKANFVGKEFFAIGTEIVDYNMHPHDDNIDQDFRAGKVIGSMSILCCTIYFIDSVICIIKGITRLTK